MESGINKKTYRPYVLWSIMLPIILSFIGMLIFGSVGILAHFPFLGESNWPRWAEITIAIGSLIMAIFFIWLITGSIKGQKIVLSDNEIYAPQDNWLKSESYQLEVHIPYAEIEDISFTVSARTSENKSVWYLRLPKDWAIFKMKDGKVKRLCIGLYTRKTEIKILDDILARCATVGNMLDYSGGSEIIKKKSKKKK